VSERSNAVGVNVRPVARDAEVGPAMPRVVTQELQLAQEFLGTLPDLRSPWSELFERFADERALAPAMRRAVRTAVLRLRIFHAIERSARRPRAAR